MSQRERRQFSGEEKVKILRLHLLEGKPVSDVCEQHKIHPTLFYQWPSPRHPAFLRPVAPQKPKVAMLHILTDEQIDPDVAAAAKKAVSRNSNHDALRLAGWALPGGFGGRDSERSSAAIDDNSHF